MTSVNEASMKQSEPRRSTRLGVLPKRYYGADRKRPLEDSGDKNVKKRNKANNSEDECVSNANQKTLSYREKKRELVIGILAHRCDVDGKITSSEEDELTFMYAKNNAVNSSGKSASVLVKETLRKFNKLYLHYLQEEEKRCRKLGNAGGNSGKRSTKRPDLKAATEMMTKKQILYPQKKIGHLPGINIGHQFFSRSEMVVVGFHGHWLNGIDYMGKTYGKLAENKGKTFPLAVSVVLSGQYEDDMDSSEEIVYTGQGGNNFLGNKNQAKDQVLHYGNLALKNNMEQSLPVRVTRGHVCDSSYSGKVYTYDGLYMVNAFWAEKGVSGFTVLKYRLKRLQGQSKLTTKQVHSSKGQLPKDVPKKPGLVCNDLSNGEEDLSIPVINTCDDPPVGPPAFVYIKSVQGAEDITIPTSAPGCKCKGNCHRSRTCSCAKLNNPDFPYVPKDGGRLTEPRDVVFECGPHCGCGPNCLNRVSQRGLKYQLEVYKTPDKGWAVRTTDFIPSGAPVCEYVGFLRKNRELDSISENDYIFEIDCWHTMNGIGGRERRLCDVSAPSSDDDENTDEDISDKEPEFCIDAGSFGNVARFINHSCEPNLFVQCVLSSHHDFRLARVVLFAADNILPMQELTYDYGYALDSVIGADGKIKTMPCYCGTGDCRKRLY